MNAGACGKQGDDYNARLPVKESRRFIELLFLFSLPAVFNLLTIVCYEGKKRERQYTRAHKKIDTALRDFT